MIATSNIPLNVPFKEKDEAKSHGARWNPTAKHWYIPEGIDDAPFTKWLDNAPADTLATSLPSPKTKEPAPSTNPPSSNDIDDINAMLRDAFENNDDSSM